MLVSAIVVVTILYGTYTSSETLRAEEDKLFLHFQQLPSNGYPARKIKGHDGEDHVQRVDLDRIAVLDNDVIDGSVLESCIEERSTVIEDSYDGSSVTFEEVAQQIGLTLQHRTSSPKRPHCQLDWKIPTTSNKTMKLAGEFCTPEMVTGGAAVGDYNNDGLDDVYFSVYEGRSVLYRNNGDGTFSDVAESVGIGASLFANGAGWFDADSDGDLDLYVTTVGDIRYYLYINYGGVFREEAKERGLAMIFPNNRKLVGMTPNFGDLNNDGYLDVYVGEWMYHNNNGKISASRLLLNRGLERPGYFTDITNSSGTNMDNEWYWFRNYFHGGTHTFCSSFTDFDNDGWSELLVSGDFGQSRMFWNNHNGTFEKCFGAKCGLTGFQDAMGHAIGDLNNDGLMEWFSTAILSPNCDLTGCPFGLGGNVLYINKGNRMFQNVANESGVLDGGWGWGAAFYDFDNNGFLDIVMTNGMEMHSSTLEDIHNKDNMRLFENKGPGFNNIMKEVAEQRNMTYHGMGRGLLLFDFDDDGDEDVFVATNYGPVQVFKNNGGNKNNWLRVRAVHRCLSDVTKLCDSYGARVMVTTDDGKTQTAEVGSKTHFLGQSTIHAHFGLDNFASANVRVYWPATNHTVHITNVTANTRLKILKPNSTQTKSEVFSSIASCSHMKITEVTHQPSRGHLSINPGGRSLKYTLPAGQRDWDQGLQTAQYKVSYRASDGNLQTAVADIEFDFRASRYFPCKDGRWLMGHQLPEPTQQRLLSGHYNNRQNTTWGAALENLFRLAHPAYTDGVSQPASTCTRHQTNSKTCPYPDLLGGLGSTRPSPREISNVLLAQSGDIFSQRNVSDFTAHFGQFLSHDMDFSSPLTRHEFGYHANHVWLPIKVPKGDPHFDPYNTGKEFIPFVRSIFNRCTGGYPGTIARQQVNKISSYIDANHVYGSDETRCLHLREKKGGRMKMGPGLMMPKNTEEIANDNPIGRPPRQLFVAGDTRANVQPGLMALQVLFLREHNRLARAFHVKNPQASDEEIFQYARKMVIAELQAITYREYLPAIFGSSKAIPEYSGYKESVRVDVSSEFATAAFRFGHSQVNTLLFRLNADGTTIKEGHGLLRELYFLPNRLEREGGIDPVFRGMTAFPAQEVDVHMVDEMRNVLFGSTPDPTGKSPGLDLAAMNIQRGREHGLLDFNSMRKVLGLKAYSSFSEISSKKDVVDKLQMLYKSIDNIDLWVGGLAEDHVEGSELGETFQTIMVEQFTRVRDGDRFWYMRNLTNEEIEEVHRMSLGKIIRLNTGFTDCPDNVFFATNKCDSISDQQCVGKPSPNPFMKENTDLKVRNGRLEDDNDEYETVIIVLAVILGVLGFLLLLLLIVFFKKKQQHTQEEELQEKYHKKAENEYDHGFSNGHTKKENGHVHASSNGHTQQNGNAKDNAVV